MYRASGYFDPPLTSPEALTQHCRDLPAGTLMARNALPPGMLIVRQFLTPAQCAAALAYAAATPGDVATVQDLEAVDTDPRAHRSNTRITDHLPTTGIDEWLQPLLMETFRTLLASHYRCEFAWYEKPSLLRYQKGGYYVPHADAENWHPQRSAWQRAVDRDLSILLYLDEKYEGGELDFANFQFRVKPTAGMLVCFPSDHRYLHAAREVTKGQRHVIVAWAARSDTPKVRPQPPADAVLL